MNDSMMWLLIAAVVVFAVMRRKEPADITETAVVEIINTACRTVEEEMDRLIETGGSRDSMN